MLEFAKQLLGWAAGLAILVGLAFLFGDHYVIQPDNAKMWLDYNNHVFVSPPCAHYRAVEPEVADSDDIELSTMVEVRIRRERGEKQWRPDDRCNRLDGFWQRITLWNRVFGYESRWYPNGEWRW